MNSSQPYNDRDLHYMGLALEQARVAAALGEVPVGAVLVQGGEIVASSHNLREQNRDALAHAELLAIAEGCKKLGGWRLAGCELYVTLEPCSMCCGGIINARLDRVIYGASDPKAGCCGSVTDLFALPFNHRPEILGGVRKEEAAALLSAFFSALRNRG